MAPGPAAHPLQKQRHKYRAALPAFHLAQCSFKALFMALQTAGHEECRFAFRKFTDDAPREFIRTVMRHPRGFAVFLAPYREALPLSLDHRLQIDEQSFEGFAVESMQVIGTARMARHG